MRNLIAGLAIGACLATGATALASSHTASLNWPARCVKMKCVNGHLNLLDARVRLMGRRVASLRARNKLLRKCVAEYPVTRYYGNNTYYYGQDTNNDGNFDQNIYNNNPFRFLDQTNSGDGVSIWVLRDSCSTPAFGRPPAP